MEIMSDLRKEGEKRIRKKFESGETDCPNSAELTNALLSFDAKMTQHEHLFTAQDGVYSSLHLIAPTEREMNTTVTRVKKMKILWCEMGFSVTPKAHLIFEHACNNQLEFGGIGDKIEDFIE